MTPEPPRYLAPPCRIDEHGYCHGPAEVRLPGDKPTEQPVLILRCDCTCHRKTPPTARP